MSSQPYDYWTPFMSNHGNLVPRSPAIREILEKAGVVKFTPMVSADEHIRTLYCIGGSLDGQIKSSYGWVLKNERQAVQPYTDYGYINEFYVLRNFKRDGHTVYFWRFNGLTREKFEDRARELFVEAAVLQDEQLICE